jgi:glycosyltransferase involved in cell wall biosynthesis
MVSRADQIEIFRKAAAVVQPSRFEGWSTVVEDAKAVGRPMLLSDIPVHLEQAPEETFFKVGSHEDLASVLEVMLLSLEPGPDKQSEAAAAEASADRGRRAAERFMEIAHEAAHPPLNILAPYD